MIAKLSGWLVNVAIAMTALRTNLMRSLLTMLGVMIGVFAVTLAVAIGQGAKESVVNSINSLGSNMAIVFPIPDNENAPRSTFDRGRLTDRDARSILALVPGVSAISPQLRNNAQFVAAGRNATTATIGATADYSQVANINAESGRFISEADVRTAARVTVLGPTVAGKLFGTFDPVGQQVRISRVPYTVIGVLEPKGSSFGSDDDDLAIVPISTARQRFTTTGVQGPDDLHALFVGFEDGYDVNQGKKEIKKLLRTRNRVPEGEISPFTIRTTAEFMEQTGQVTSILQALLVGIASISLLVGGIGIMNIMLVSVTERTREIGLRMALGARKRDIRNQFLVEAAVLCVMGGAAGLLFAFLAAWAITSLAGFAVPVGIGIAIFAILFSATIGLAFGGYPAVRASRLSPIEALRSE